MDRFTSTVSSWPHRFPGTVRWFALALGMMAVVASPADRAWAQLVDTQAAMAIQQDMQAGNAGNAAAAAGRPEAAAPAAPSSGSSGFSVKYVPAYVIVLLLVALGAFIVCRPGNRHDAT